MKKLLLLLFALLPFVKGPLPAELPPIKPSLPILWMTVPAPAFDLPAAPLGRPVKLLRLGPGNVFGSQSEFSAFCANLDTKDNIVYANDPLNPGRVVTTGCIYLPSYVAPNAMSTELTGMQGNSLPGVDVVALRNQFHGDLVVLYDNDGSACGLGYLNASLSGKAWGFSVVNKGCADSNFSDVHERGHNFGLNHDEQNAGYPSGFPPGFLATFPNLFGFCDGKGHRSPMVYPSPCGGSRVPYFGNPDISPFGTPFGDANHDEARVIRWAMPIVANFYPPLEVVPPPSSGGKPSLNQ